MQQRDTSALGEIFSKLTTKTQEQHQRHRSEVFIGNLEQISYNVMVFPLLHLNK